MQYSYTLCIHTLKIVSVQLNVNNIEALLERLSQTGAGALIKSLIKQQNKPALLAFLKANLRDCVGCNIIAYAAASGNFDILSALIEFLPKEERLAQMLAPADKNFGASSRSAIEYAVKYAIEKKDATVLDVMLGAIEASERLALVSTPCDGGEPNLMPNLLYLAISDHNSGVVMKRLLACIPLKKRVSFLKKQNILQETLLHYCIDSQCLENIDAVLKDLKLKETIDLLNMKNEFGESVLDLLPGLAQGSCQEKDFKIR